MLNDKQAKAQLLWEQDQLAKFGSVKSPAPQFNLQGTLVKEPDPKPTTFSAPNLPQARQGSTDAFSSVMRKVSKFSAREQIDPISILNEYKDAGVDVSGSMQGINAAITTAKSQRIPFIEDTFKSAVELITKQEKQRADYQKQLMDVLPKEAISLMLQRGQIGDLQQLSDGKTPDSLIQALKDIPKENLAGTSTDLRTFATLRPDLKVGTPEFQQGFNQFIAQQKALQRPPKTTDDLSLTRTEKLKLEQAGLASSDRQDQITFLFGTPQEQEGVKRKVQIPQKQTGAINDATEVTEWINEQKEFGDSFDAIVQSLIDAFGIGKELATRLVQINF